MTILDEIIAWKRKEVDHYKLLRPLNILERDINRDAVPCSLQKYIRSKEHSGIIAEFKRKSPSKGFINEEADPAVVCSGYRKAGASALSVLTDTKFFAGSNYDLEIARRYNQCPILRKDFTIDEYQVVEARSIGADAILLIAEVLTKNELTTLYELAKGLNLEVLFEIHDEASIDKLPADANIIGINSRNLCNFEVSIEHTMRLAGKLPKGAIKIAESGIDSASTIVELRRAGFDGFLIGERFMREPDPGLACKSFIEEINAISI